MSPLLFGIIKDYLSRYLSILENSDYLMLITDRTYANYASYTYKDNYENCGNMLESLVANHHKKLKSLVADQRSS